MRKLFSELLYKHMSKNKDIILLTGDLGYGLWDKIRLDYQDRFINLGSAEQLMIGTSVGLAMEGKIPVVYSITPFLLYRPFEFIRNYINKEKIPVKLIGGGRDKDYGKLGFSHHAEDDKEIMSVFKNIEVFHPETDDELMIKTNEILNNNKPSYLNLKR